MSDQETLPGTVPEHDPDVHSLWTRFVDDGQVRDVLWLNAVEAAEFVGTCRECGGFLKPHKPIRVSKNRFDYEAECVQCGQEVVCPDGKVSRRKAGPGGRTRAVGSGRGR